MEPLEEVVAAIRDRRGEVRPVVELKLEHRLGVIASQTL
jgi:hypothetical protein